MTAVIVLFIVVGIWDTASNWGKAYGNVSVAGIDVSGMNEQEIQDTLKEAIWPKVSETDVTVFSSADARESSKDDLAEMERIMQANELSAEEAQKTATSWTTDVYGLNGNVPFDKAAKAALDVGRGDGGIFGMLGLFLFHRDLPISVEFDAQSLDEFALNIDKAIGDIRIDTTVAVEDGVAHPVEGHDGWMVDRDWLATELSSLMLSDQDDNTLIAYASDAPSRISQEDAQAMSDSINRAIGDGAEFTYQDNTWKASAKELGSWVEVSVVPDGSSAKLEPTINSTAAITGITNGADATVKLDELLVTFEVDENDNVTVRKSGPGTIPEVPPAVESLQNSLFGQNGKAWNQNAASSPIAITVDDSDAPETMSFEDAYDLGVITVIGEFTTEFSTAEGTENRNHNIKVAAGLLNNSIAKADGGTWSFNETSGDTTQDPPFASAPSILGGVYTDSIGGGICQVATTVFNSVLEAGLPVVQRSNHTVYMRSYPSGRDASVSYPEEDFIWKNDLPSDVLLTLTYAEGSLTAKLYSVYTGYKTEIVEDEWKMGGTYGTEFITDDTLPTGMYYLKSTGVDGHSTSITRTVKNADGQTILEDTYPSTYNVKDEVYAVGPGTDTSFLSRNVESYDTDTSGYYA